MQRTYQKIIQNGSLKCLTIFKNCPNIQSKSCLQKCLLSRIKTLEQNANTSIDLTQTDVCQIENTLDKTHHLHKACIEASELLNDDKEQENNYDAYSSNDCCLSRTFASNFSNNKDCYYIRESDEISDYEYIESLPYSENIIKARILYKGQQIISIAIIINYSIILSDSEQCYYRNSCFPLFYSYLLKVDQSIPQCIIFLEEAKGNLKENLMNFWKKRAQEKADLKSQRIQQAIQLFKDLISDMKMYKHCGIDHHLGICPERILVYEGQNTECGMRFKLVSNQFEYKKTNENSIGQRVINIDQKISLRYLPPEIAYIEYYYKKLGISYEENNEARDVWAIGTCVLSMMTDKMIDKWNFINWESSLAAIVIKEFAGYKKVLKCVLGCLLLDSRKRAKIIEIGKKLEVEVRL